MANQDTKFVAVNDDGDYLAFGDGTDPQWVKATEDENCKPVVPEACFLSEDQIAKIEEMLDSGTLTAKTAAGEIGEVEFLEWDAPANDSVLAPM
jgi:hypothetical protein